MGIGEFDMDAEAAGGLAATLLCREVSWVRRRKVRVDFLDDIAMRVKTSVDFCVPTDVEPTGRDARGNDLLHLPLFVLRKAPQQLIDFDLVDCQGRALSLPTRAFNAEVSAAALEAQAAKTLERELPGARIPSSTRESIGLTARGGLEDSLDACDRLLERRGALAGIYPEPTLADDGDFRFLARLISWSSIISIPVRLDSGEGLYKLSYSELIDEWGESWNEGIRTGASPLPASIDLPFTGARSFHLEAHPPRGMAVSRGDIGIRTRELPRYHHTVGSGRAMHLYAPQVEEGRSGVAFLELRAQRSGFMDSALIACASVVAVLILSTLFAPRLATANAAAPTLLLFLPGLLATFALSPSEHQLTQRVLGRLRLAVGICAAAAFLAAFWFLAAPREDRSGPAIIAAQPIAAVESSRPPAARRRDRPTRPKRRVRPRERPTQQHGAGARSQAEAVSGEPTAHAADATMPSEEGLRWVWGILAGMASIATALVFYARLQALP